MPALRPTAFVSRSVLRRAGKLHRWSVALALLLVGACSKFQHRPGNPAAHTTGTADARGAAPTPGSSTPAGELLGTVRVIGTGGRFVLVETPAVQPVARLVDGQTLVCRAAGAVSATLRVSRERRPPFLVADVAAGEPHVGDEVFIDTGLGRTVIAAPASSALSPAPDSSPPPIVTPDFRAAPALPPTR